MRAGATFVPARSVLAATSAVARAGQFPQRGAVLARLDDQLVICWAGALRLLPIAPSNGFRNRCAEAGNAAIARWIMSRETSAGLFSTAPDYLAFTRMLLAGGVLDGVRVLKQETVKLMARNAIVDPNVLMGAQQQSRIGARSRDIPWSGQEMEVDFPKH